MPQPPASSVTNKWWVLLLLEEAEAEAEGPPALAEVPGSVTIDPPQLVTFGVTPYAPPPGHGPGAGNVSREWQSVPVHPALHLHTPLGEQTPERVQSVLVLQPAPLLRDGATMRSGCCTTVAAAIDHATVTSRAAPMQCMVQIRRVLFLQEREWMECDPRNPKGREHW